MNADAPRSPRIQQVTTTGTALAAALLPLMVGVLVAKSLGADPMAPVNALIAGGGQRPRVCPAQLRGCGRSALLPTKYVRGLSRAGGRQRIRSLGRGNGTVAARP
ncbi:hypothetical protein [Streptomyces sp. NPDC019507]|uniref:hypothetical protein n=1 Tax=Streptomyces sp. NPDC019507 TaxID=3154689 RepID=UPI0033C04552